MAPNVTEATPLLVGYVINMPKEKHMDPDVNEVMMDALSLKELMPFEHDPYWQNVRKSMMIIFWACILVTFTAACIIAISEHNKGLCFANKTIVMKIGDQGLRNPPDLKATAGDFINDAAAKVLAMAL